MSGEHEQDQGNTPVDPHGSSQTLGPIQRTKRVDFQQPPVVETWLGVQFVPMRRLSLPYIGLFWADVRSRYPAQEVKPPLAPVIEEFPLTPGSPGFGVQLFSEPDARCWFIDQTRTQLIQVQRDRFIRNWRKGPPPHDRYPRFDELRPRFQNDWNDFLRFLEREDLGTAEINQCEVTYINHVDLGVGWNSFAEISQILTLLGSPTSREILPDPEIISLNAAYAMPDKAGRLHIGIQPAVRRQDRTQVLQLTLTARGKPTSSKLDDILRWFDLGHEWIVHGFVDVTTPKMHKIWGRL